MTPMNTKNIILYDGTCGICNQMILWIVRRDTRNVFTYISNSSQAGVEYIELFQLQPYISETIVFISNERFYIKSNAVLRILNVLYNTKLFLNIFQYVPLKIRDFLYDFIAKNRYLISKNTCNIADQELLKRLQS